MSASSGNRSGSDSGSSSATRRVRMSYEEFLTAWDGVHAEWVDGVVVPMSPASNRHQDLVGFLATIMRTFAEANDLGVVRIAPFQMKLGPRLPGREPDLLFVTRTRADRLRKNFLDGPADLAVEIVSDDSRLRDRGAKLAEYEMGGVSEYWVIDPDTRRADFHVLGADARYARAEPAADGVYRSRALTGFWLRVAWLWQEPLPRLAPILRELGAV